MIKANVFFRKPIFLNQFLMLASIASIFFLTAHWTKNVFSVNPVAESCGDPQPDVDPRICNGAPVMAIQNLHIPNIYPLSNRQLIKHIDQEEIHRRISALFHPTDQQQQWHPKLAEIIRRYKWPGLMMGADDVRSLKEMLRFALEKAIENELTADSTDLIEILVASTSMEKDEILDQDFCARMCNNNEVGNTARYRTILLGLCKMERGIYRDQSFEFDENRAKVQAQLIDAYLAENKADEPVLETHGRVFDIWTRSNFSQLRITLGQPLANGRSIGEQIAKMRKTNRRSHFLQTLQAIATDTLAGRPHFFAGLLKEKLLKLVDWNPANDADAHWDIQRILLWRAQIDLAHIAHEFGTFVYGTFFKGETVVGLLNALHQVKRHLVKKNDKRKLEGYIEIVNFAHGFEDEQQQQH